MAANYRVISQAPKAHISTTGQSDSVMEVTIETIPSGTMAKVNVPVAAYTVSEVDRLATALATTIEEVAAL